MYPSFYFKENGEKIRSSSIVQQKQKGSSKPLENIIECIPMPMNQMQSDVPLFKNKPYRLQILQRMQINNSLSMAIMKPVSTNKKVRNLVREKIKRSLGIKDIEIGDIDFGNMAE